MTPQALKENLQLYLAITRGMKEYAPSSLIDVSEAALENIIGSEVALRAFLVILRSLGARRGEDATKDGLLFAFNEAKEQMGA